MRKILGISTVLGMIGIFWMQDLAVCSRTIDTYMKEQISMHIFKNRLNREEKRIAFKFLTAVMIPLCFVGCHKQQRILRQPAFEPGKKQGENFIIIPASGFQTSLCSGAIAPLVVQITHADNSISCGVGLYNQSSAPYTINPAVGGSYQDPNKTEIDCDTSGGTLIWKYLSTDSQTLRNGFVYITVHLSYNPAGQSTCYQNSMGTSMATCVLYNNDFRPLTTCTSPIVQCTALSNGILSCPDF